MQTFATANRSATVLGFFMAISSTILISLTPITESVDDLDVLDVLDSISSIIEIFHVLLETFIRLLLVCLQAHSS
jgi:hypothetical protein